MNFPAVVLTLTFAFSANLAVAKPMPVIPTNVRVEREVAYLPAGRSEMADLYFPMEMPKGRGLPAVVWIHGGGWNGGRKDASRGVNVCGTLTYVRKTSPPFLILHGTADTTVNIEQSKWLDAALTKAGVLHDFVIIASRRPPRGGSPISIVSGWQMIPTGPEIFLHPGTHAPEPSAPMIRIPHREQPA